MSKGKVIIAGAGIGSADLITVRAKNAIEEADVIIFDRLLNRDLITPYEGKKELYYAGKSAADHYLSQDEINALMVKKAREGKTVLRLKGGDPYVFGRGGEEAEYLVAHDIDFEVIPGVTAGVVSLMYAGIPATHRDVVTSITFATGHRKKGVIGNFQEYGKLEGNLVFYMGLNNLSKITAELMEGGMDPEKPAAVIMNGAYPSQRVFVSKVGTIAEEIKKENFGSPSLIVIGDGVPFRESLNFYEKLPLFGKKIVVTRARTQASKLVKKLEDLGADVTQAPTIEIRRTDPTPLRKALEDWNYTHVVFHSVNGTKIFFDEFMKHRDVRDLAGVKCCAVGESTARMLRKRGIEPDIVPDRFVGEELVEAIGNDDVKDRRILLPHSMSTRKKLLDDYKKIGKLTPIPVYESVMPEELAELPEDPDYVLFMSSTTVSNFVKAYGIEVLKRAKTVSIGPITSGTLKETGVEPDLESEKSTIDSLVECVKEDVAHENA